MKREIEKLVGETWMSDKVKARLTKDLLALFERETYTSQEMDAAYDRGRSDATPCDFDR